ncbi:hypothetical protein QNN00_18780 [Bacillus velezensis]|nr:hypothetical protein [Bacillus velezensis]
MKRLKDAEADQDHIYGVIIGSGINQDGKTNGITAPSAKSQMDLERQCMKRTTSTLRASPMRKCTAPAQSRGSD